MSIEVVPLEAGLGAEVRGLDISEPLAVDTVAAIRAAWLEYCVLLFRDQTLKDDQLLTFTRQFGELEFPPTKLLGLKNKIDQQDEVPPEINVISNVKENGVAIGQLGADECAWHTDSAFVEIPPAASLLYALEIPPDGGNTSFLNMYTAWETLDPAVQKAVEDRAAKHDFTYTSAGHRRKDYPQVTDPSKAPGPSHPIVRTHPETKRKCLYLGRRLNSYIMGLPLDESEKLLDKLWLNATKPEFSYEHVWAVGDLIMWDNRCAMHRREAFSDTQRRVMHRSQLQGDQPYH